jgi:hypothetical protein
MGFEFANLDETTRRYMLQELEHDLAQGTLYLSPRLSPEGRASYPDLLAEALRTHDDSWLAEQLRRRGDLNPYEERHTAEGDLVTARLPANAPEVLAGDDFNRFYMRGLCARALAEGVGVVEVYRGRASAQPRPESQALIGQSLPAADLLEDLRAWPRPPVLGIPTGFNSGLTLRLPAADPAES